MSLGDTCTDLAGLLPRVHVLIWQPDADGTAGGSKPGSRPPWNQAAANAFFDAKAKIRETEHLFRLIITGRPGTSRSWSDVSTLKALAAIEALGAALPHDRVTAAAHDLSVCVTAIMQLPAIDEAERFIRIRGRDCPYCGPRGFTGSLRASPRTGRVACIRYTACQDANGNTPVGTMGRSQLDGTACVTWADGLVT